MNKTINVMNTNNDNCFTAEYIFDYYNSHYNKFSETSTDIATVRKFVQKYGSMYPNDIDATCDLLKDYVLARKGLY